MIQTENSSRYRRNCLYIRRNHSHIIQSGDVDIYDYVLSTVTFPDTNNPAITARQAHRSLKACSPSNRCRRIRKQPVWFRDYETEVYIGSGAGFQNQDYPVFSSDSDWIRIVNF